METYARVLLFAIPSFLFLVMVEKIWGWLRGNDTVRWNDMISSLGSGMTNVTKDVLRLSVVVISYGWLVDRVALIKIPEGWLTYVAAFIILDFAGYWVHRIAHQVNLFWNNHIIHHSSEEFNLACALRQSISSIVRIFAVFLLPAALLGVPAKVIEVIAPLHLFAQFWYHTRHIGKMGFLEMFLVTPSHHRVHHAINPEYLDKNYGQIFIFWDKWFGTFQEESPEIPCRYGVTRPVQTWNPVRINFMHLWLLIRDAWFAPNWRDKLRIWLMPLGWRPAGAEIRFPVVKASDSNYKQYNAGDIPWLLLWSAAQLLATLMLFFWLLVHLAEIGAPAIYAYGALIILNIMALTELMDQNPRAWIWDSLRFLFGVLLMMWCGSEQGHWLGWFAASGEQMVWCLSVWWLAAICISGYSCSRPGFSLITR